MVLLNVLMLRPYPQSVKPETVMGSSIRTPQVTPTCSQSLEPDLNILSPVSRVVLKTKCNVCKSLAQCLVHSDRAITVHYCIILYPSFSHHCQQCLTHSRTESMLIEVINATWREGGVVQGNSQQVVAENWVQCGNEGCVWSRGRGASGLSWVQAKGEKGIGFTGFKNNNKTNYKSNFFLLSPHTRSS